MRVKKDVNIGIGARIQTARETAGYTQEQLSELLQMSPNHLSSIECGVSGCSMENLQKICRILNVSADSIVFEETSKDGTMAKILLLLERFKPECLHHVGNVIEKLAEIPQIAEHE